MRVEGTMVEEEQEEETQEVTAPLETRVGAAAAGAVQPPMTVEVLEVLETVEIVTVLPLGTTGSALEWCWVG